MMRRWMDILTEAASYDPLKLDRLKSCFLWYNGEFIPVAYQRHLAMLGTLFSRDIPDSKDWGARAEVYDALQAVAVKHHIVQGEYQPGGRNLNGILTLVGALKDCRAAYAAFRQRWPEQIAELDVVSLTILGVDGQRVGSNQWLEDTKIDRKMGNRHQ